MKAILLHGDNADKITAAAQECNYDVEEMWMLLSEYENGENRYWVDNTVESYVDEETDTVIIPEPQWATYTASMFWTIFDFDQDLVKHDFAEITYKD